MNNKLQKWALTAEIISGFAVVITLLILIVEIQNNTEIVRLSAYQQQISEISDWRESMYSNPSLANSYSMFLAGEAQEIPSQESLRLSLALSNLWNTYEGAYYSYQGGLLDEREWNRMQAGICALFNRLVQSQRYLNTMRFYSTTEFNQYIESTCAQ